MISPVFFLVETLNIRLKLKNILRYLLELKKRTQVSVFKQKIKFVIQTLAINTCISSL